jgi:hypothetical protein
LRHEGCSVHLSGLSGRRKYGVILSESVEDARKKRKNHLGPK